MYVTHVACHAPPQHVPPTLTRPGDIWCNWLVLPLLKRGHISVSSWPPLHAISTYQNNHRAQILKTTWILIKKWLRQLQTVWPNVNPTGMRSASCVGSQVLTVPPAANRATAMYARERGQTRRMVLRREHDNLQDVLLLALLQASIRRFKCGERRHKSCRPRKD